MAFIAEHAVKRQQQTKLWIGKETHILRGVIVTDLLRQYSEEHRVLSALNLLSIYDHDALRASPTMEAQMAWQVMADMFNDDGSVLLASCVALHIVKHSGVSKHELRFHDVHS